MKGTPVHKSNPTVPYRRTPFQWRAVPPVHNPSPQSKSHSILPSVFGGPTKFYCDDDEFEFDDEYHNRPSSFPPIVYYCPTYFFPLSRVPTEPTIYGVPSLAPYCPSLPTDCVPSHLLLYLRIFFASTVPCHIFSPYGTGAFPPYCTFPPTLPSHASSLPTVYFRT
mmetsp:Transcript_56876/g.64459  ORF Transcript_56876/g.64459 Transcript_56876/m.64459 type:complete len:166 (-) Transcript_56876:85-582(-)